MTDFATPNLPSRNFDATERFYAKLGFACGWRNEGWMILHRGPKGSRIALEFFPHPELKPEESWFSCCLRLDDLDAMIEVIRSADIPEIATDFPRLQSPRREASGLEIGYLVDIDGTLLRLIRNETD